MNWSKSCSREVRNRAELWLATVLIILMLGILFSDRGFAMTLHCPTLQSYNGQVGGVEIRGVSGKAREVEFDNYLRPPGVQFFNSTSGPCRGKMLEGYDCFQSGQMVINIPKQLAFGQRPSGFVWINGDKDDDMNAGRKGERYFCYFGDGSTN